MHLFVPESQIDFDDGFSEKNDIFGRKNFGEMLTRIVSNSSSPLTIAIEGQWGSGKTTFLRLWASELRKTGFPVIFFDAFQADFHSDAFLPLVAEIVSLAKSHSKAKSSTEFTKKAVNVGKIIARSAIKIGVKAATVGALSDTDFESVASDIASGASDAIDKHVSDIILGKEKEDAAREAFSKALENLVDDINDESDQKKPLIFIIDELDRARPDFALSIMEKIKHFFNVNNVHFVFGANLEQLSATIKHMYGIETDAKIYLEKFIHFSIRLTDENDQFNHRNTEIYADRLQKTMELPNLKDGTASYAVKFIGKISSKKRISLRSVERIMTNLAVAIASTPEGYIFPPAIAAGIAVIKSTNGKLFQSIISSEANYDEIIVELGIDKDFQESDGADLNYARDEWRRFLGPINEEEKRRFSSLFFNYSFSKREDVVRHIAQRFAQPTLVRVGNESTNPSA